MRCNITEAHQASLALTICRADVQRETNICLI